MATRADLKRKIQKPLDMEEETFVTEDELNDYIDEGLKECSAIIHNLYEDYFQTQEYVSLVTDEDSYDLPEDIFARKIRRIFYNDGNVKYEVLPIDLEQVAFVQDTDLYRYRIDNNASDGVQLKLYPASRETSSSNLTIYYLRDVILPESDSDDIDIPEFDRFVIEYVRLKILEKEMDNPMLASTSVNFERIKQLMIDTLQESIPDGNNEMELNTDFYTDYYSNSYYDY